MARYVAVVEIIILYENGVQRPKKHSNLRLAILSWLPLVVPDSQNFHRTNRMLTSTELFSLGEGNDFDYYRLMEFNNSGINVKRKGYVERLWQSIHINVVMFSLDAN